MYPFFPPPLANLSQANGFYGSPGLSGLIPEGYTLLEQRFMRAVRAAGRLSHQHDDSITLSEWERQGWTYHAKGSLCRFSASYGYTHAPQASGYPPPKTVHPC